MANTEIWRFFWNVGRFAGKSRTPGEKSKNNLHWTQLCVSQLSSPSLAMPFSNQGLKSRNFEIMTHFEALPNEGNFRELLGMKEFTRQIRQILFREMLFFLFLYDWALLTRQRFTKRKQLTYHRTFRYLQLFSRVYLFYAQSGNNFWWWAQSLEAALNWNI